MFNLILVNFKYLDEMIALLHGHLHLVQDPRARECSLRHDGMRSFGWRVYFSRARSTQAEQNLYIASEW
jgi:hypothetical protein